MKSINIIHVSKTPLVGAPGTLSEYLNYIENFNSIHFTLNEYPEQLRFFFTKNSVHLDLKNKLLKNLFTDCIQNADIIHIHNDVDNPEVIDILMNNQANKSFIYQIHSPYREPPIFINKSKDLPFRFAKKLVIAQVHPRLYPDFEIVPNIVDFNPTKKVISRLNEKIRILFAPSHKRTKGVIFSTKFTENQEDIFNKICKDDKFELINIDKPIAPNVLAEIRKRSDISIDEIATGGFHQVSYEALACGNIVVNNADLFSKEIFANAIQADELPPFVRACDQNLWETLQFLKNNEQYLLNKRQESLDYFIKYMMPLRLVQRFVQKYKEVL